MEYFPVFLSKGPFYNIEKENNIAADNPPSYIITVDEIQHDLSQRMIWMTCIIRYTVQCVVVIEKLFFNNEYSNLNIFYQYLQEYDQVEENIFDETNFEKSKMPKS